jgi:DNA polymerase elongation subunit (family B)
MASEIVFDIETAPDNVPQSLLDELFSKIEPTKEAEKKGEQAIKDYIKKKQDEIVADFALSPMTGKILGIGIYCGGYWAKNEFPNMKVYKEEDELDMLEWFNYQLKNDPPRLISFNGKSFDAHFIKVRSAILGYNFDYQIDTKRYDTKNHFDVREVLTNFGANPKGTLRQWAIAFGLEPPKDTGENIHLLTKEERSAKCLKDCQITYEIFNKLKHSF